MGDCISSIAISPDSKYIVSGSWDSKVTLWDSLTGKQVICFTEHSQEVSAVCFSIDSTLIVSGSYDKSICLRARSLEHESWRCIATPRGHEDAISSVTTYQLDDQIRIVSGSWDTTLRIWDNTGGALGMLKGHRDSVESVSASKDGHYIVSGSLDQTVRIWSGRDYSSLACLTKEGLGEVISVAFSSDDSEVVSAHSDDVVRRWNWTNATSDSVVATSGKLGSLEHLVVTNDGLRALSSGDSDSSLQLWELSKNTSRVIHLQSAARSESVIVTSLAISPDSQFVVIGGSDGVLQRKEIHAIMHIDPNVGQHQVSSTSIAPRSQASLPLLQELIQLLRKLNRNADSAKYSNQQILRVLGDSQLLAAQMDIELRASITSSNVNDTSNTLLQLADDAVVLGSFLADLAPTIDACSTYSNLTSFNTTVLKLRSLLYWIHRRPYFKSPHTNWDERYFAMLIYDVDRLIERLVAVVLSDRKEASSFRYSSAPDMGLDRILKSPTSSSNADSDLYELLTQLLYSFQWLKQPAVFERAVMLEAATWMYSMLSRELTNHPRNTVSNGLEVLSVKKEIASILSDSKSLLQDKNARLRSPRDLLANIHSRWSAIAYTLEISNAISGTDVYDLFTDKSISPQSSSFSKTAAPFIGTEPTISTKASHERSHPDWHALPRMIHDLPQRVRKGDSEKTSRDYTSTYGQQTNKIGSQLKIPPRRTFRQIFSPGASSSKAPTSTARPFVPPSAKDLVLQISRLKAICFVDDSTSMDDLWSEARTALAGFTDFIKSNNGDGIDLFFPNSDNNRKCTSSLDVHGAFSDILPSGTGYLWPRLQTFLMDQNLETKHNPHYLMFLVEGKISDDSAEEILGACYRYEDQVQKGIQIVQMGNNAVTTESLQKLSKKISAAGYSEFAYVSFGDERGPLTTDTLTSGLQRYISLVSSGME
ncbi:hypothetical protein FRC02_010117 [Tulasnella sp. 418]|nr:hypothetical protein FRC02_010117 [Tulasnella sp. 418]